MTRHGVFPLALRRPGVEPTDQRLGSCWKVAQGSHDSGQRNVVWEVWRVIMHGRVHGPGALLDAVRLEQTPSAVIARQCGAGAPALNGALADSKFRGHVGGRS